MSNDVIILKGDEEWWRYVNLLPPPFPSSLFLLFDHLLHLFTSFFLARRCAASCCRSRGSLLGLDCAWTASRDRRVRLVCRLLWLTSNLSSKEKKREKKWKEEGTEGWKEEGKGRRSRTQPREEKKESQRGKEEADKGNELFSFHWLFLIKRESVAPNRTVTTTVLAARSRNEPGRVCKASSPVAVMAGERTNERTKEEWKK